MRRFLKRKKNIFDVRVLRKNDISLLILDERWNSLFNNIEKTHEIEKCEERLRQLLKDEARLREEQRRNSVIKKKCMKKIVELTEAVYEDHDEKAANEMECCQKEILRINKRAEEIEEELEKIPDLIKETNLQLLDYMVNKVYFRIRAARKRVEELDVLIEKTREQLKQYIDEREMLAQDDTDVYSYFHDLLGREELERLDREYFKDYRVPKTGAGKGE